jgi:hypothetical protein
MKITYTCMCHGMPGPGVMCGHVIVSNKNLCGYKGEQFCEFKREGCVECGAKNKEEAETKCICAGDKDDCHGCHVWTD